MILKIYIVFFACQVRTTTLKNCTKEMVVEYHNKTVYDCQNVTKRHCTTLWTVSEDGQKVGTVRRIGQNCKRKLLQTVIIEYFPFQVWAGNEDDCRDVTWEECSPVNKQVYIFKMKLG